MMKLYLQGHSHPPKPTAPIVYKSVYLASDLKFEGEGFTENGGQLAFYNPAGGVWRKSLPLKANQEYTIEFTVMVADGNAIANGTYRLRVLDDGVTLLDEALAYFVSHTFTTTKGLSKLEIETPATAVHYTIGDVAIREV